MKDRVRRTQEERKAATRASLITAGREVFLQNPYASIDDVLNRATVSKGSFYPHFLSYDQFRADVINADDSGLVAVACLSLDPTALYNRKAVAEIKRKLMATTGNPIHDAEQTGRKVLNTYDLDLSITPIRANPINERNKSALTRESILATGVRTVYQKGYSARLEDIVQPTGLSRGGFYAYFRTRGSFDEALLVKAEEHITEGVATVSSLPATMKGKALMDVVSNPQVAVIASFLGLPATDKYKPLHEGVTRVLSTMNHYFGKEATATVVGTYVRNRFLAKPQRT